MKVLFCKISSMKYYKGASQKDVPYNGGSYVNENGLTIAKSGNRAITCPCWSVRGHYRHYKNGNVIFVKSYEKGKEKGKVKPKDKIYTI